MAKKQHNAEDSMQQQDDLLQRRIQTLIKWLGLLVTLTLSKRFVAMILLSLEFSINRVMELTQLSDRTVYDIKRKMNKQTPEAIAVLLQIKSGRGRKGALTDVEDEIIAEVNSNNYVSHQHIADMIKEKFKITTNRWSVRNLLKKKRMKRLKVGSLPAKANVKEQRAFYEEKLLPLMKKAQDGLGTLLFMDASHFVMGCDYLGYIYCMVRRWITTFSGRKRYNVLGSLNFVTKRVITVANDTYITSAQVCEMLEKIALEYAGQEIYVILDNAKYQKCAVVTERAKKLNINLVYIPPYSPNLNLIERLWKFVKNKLRLRFWDNFSLFSSTIDGIIASTTGENKEKIDSLIGEKVQLFDEGKQELRQVTENSYEFVNIRAQDVA